MTEPSSGTSTNTVRDLDAATGQPTTGHEWDGIKELDRPLPRWWLWTFYGTIVWALVYVVLFPAIPLISDASRGILGYSSRHEVHEQLDAVRDAQAGFRDRVIAMDLEAISADEELARFAVTAGRSAFLVNCVQCHGSGAAGSRGYPNLNDDDWLWGGSLDAIHATISHGVRFMADGETRNSEMPAFGRDALLSAEDIAAVTEHVLTLTDQEADPTLATAGAKVFAENCVTCHGEDGRGNREVGAPPLNDAIWLYGTGRDAVLAQIREPRQGVMPAWAARLDAATLKELAIYIHRLGGGERTESAAN